VKLLESTPVASKNELRAEAVRDIGILFFVFAPLDTLLRGDNRHWWDWPLAGVLAVLGLILIEVGVKMGAGEP
jgi:hypothetical protein